MYRHPRQITLSFRVSGHAVCIVLLLLRQRPRLIRDFVAFHHTLSSGHPKAGPRITYMPYPFQIVQTPTQMTILYEFVHAVRNIFMDSPHPEGPIEWWLGDSRGRWEGDTLVVDVIHFNDQTWFDRAGNFHSEELHVVERYTPLDRNLINYEITIEDPKVFTRPWKMSMPLYRRVERNSQLFEFECYLYLYESKFN